MEPETTPNRKHNKEKLPPLWATDDIDRHSVTLDSTSFFLKIKHSLSSGHRNGMKLKKKCVKRNYIVRKT